jgi:hypothetical protein
MNDMMMNKLRHHWNVSSRREFFTRAGSGLAAIALANMLAEDGYAAGSDPLAPKAPSAPVRAKNVIWCFMEGAPSSIDTVDYKPLLEKLAGQPVPDSFGTKGMVGGQGAKPTDGIMPAIRPFKQRGQSGLWISDYLPNIAEFADDIAVIQSCHTDANAHVTGVCEMNTGSFLAGRPSLGAWVTYGLGSAVRNLPTFIAMQDDKEIIGSVQNYGSGFLPATYQGTMLRQGDTPFLNLKPPPGVTDAEERANIEFVQKMDGIYQRDKPNDFELDARTRSYELAYQMQSAAPEAVDLSKESAATRKLYGMDEKETAVYGANLLMARRLVERGVRFVECYSGSGSGWDGHTEIVANHDKWCKASDKPVAGLLADLKARGMLKDTLVVWGGEFGRTPFMQLNSVTGQRAKNPGRDHNPWGFSMWMAGGGVKGGQSIGTKDEIGLRAAEDPYHVWDVHASILYLLGLDHLKTTYMHNGRAERPTVTGGKLIPKLWT